LAGQTVTLVNPDAGEYYPRNGSTRIIWQYANLQGSARLVLFQGSTNLGIIADNLPLSPQKYFWSTGQHQGGTAPAGNGYHVRIRVTDPVHGTVIADGPNFNIGPAQIGTMEITNPTASTNWSLNQTHDITWSKSAGTHSIRVSIALYRGDVFQRWVSNNTENDGVFEWFIPQSLGPYQNNRLKIQSVYTAAQTPFFAIGMLYQQKRHL
ncbi:MAG TPA: hypothetical protein VF451_04800, partial [Acidobacteriota bacterium]